MTNIRGSIETIEGVPRELLHHVPGFDRVINKLGSGPEEMTRQQKRLQKYRGHLAVVGQFEPDDFESSSSFETKADKLVTILRESGVVNKDRGLQVRAAIVTRANKRNRLSYSAEALSEAIDKSAAAEKTSVGDPVPLDYDPQHPVKSVNDTVYRAVEDLDVKNGGWEEDFMEPEEDLILVVPPITVAPALRGVNEHQLISGEPAVLTKVDNTPEGNIWVPHGPPPPGRGAYLETQ